MRMREIAGGKLPSTADQSDIRLRKWIKIAVTWIRRIAIARYFNVQNADVQEMLYWSPLSKCPIGAPECLIFG